MVCIASLPPGERARSESISESAHVPTAFLSKILRRLVEAGLLDSEKGHHGGFKLARPARSVRLLDVLEAVDLQLIDNECAFGVGNCHPQQPCPLHPIWLELKQALLTWAASHTLADVDCTMQIPSGR